MVGGRYGISIAAIINSERPTAYNALNLNIRNLIADKFNELKAHEDIRAVIITGKEKAFADYLVKTAQEPPQPSLKNAKLLITANDY